MTESAAEIVIVGAGNLGKLVFDCLDDDPRWRCKGFIDDAKAGSTAFDLPIFSTADYDPSFGRRMLLAVGFPESRRRLIERLAHIEVDWVTFIDRRSMVGPRAVLGRGVLVLPFAMVASGVQLGDFSYVSSYAHAGIGATIGAYTSVMGGATVGEGAVGEGCILGLKSACLDGAVIGDGAVVAPYAFVRCEVPAGALAVGAPARIFKQSHRSPMSG